MELDVIIEQLVPNPSLSLEVGDVGRLLCDDGNLDNRQFGDGGAIFSAKSSGAGSLTLSIRSNSTGTTTSTGMTPLYDTTTAAGRLLNDAAIFRTRCFLVEDEAEASRTSNGSHRKLTLYFRTRLFLQHALLDIKK